MKIAGKKPWYLEYLLIIVGTGLMGTAITSCFDAAGMVTGGFSGIAILVKAWTKGLYGNGIPLWVTNLILNVPLFLLATKIKGFAFVRKALLGDISLTIWLAILPAWKLSEDFLLVALYGSSAGNWNWICISRWWNDCRNRYAGCNYPEISATLFYCTDHAVYRWRDSCCRHVCIWSGTCALCNYCGISCYKSI